MNICRKHVSIFMAELVVILLLSTNAFTATDFYILSNDSDKKVDCDFLEIKNNKTLCTSNNLLITYDITYVKHIEIVHEGTSQYFQDFTQETIDKINELNLDKSATEDIEKQEDNIKKLFDLVPTSAQSLIHNFTNQSGNNSLNTILAISGLIILLIGSFSFLIATFRTGILWGLTCMFLPFISFIFLFVHWKSAAKPFLLSILGITLLFLSTMLLPTARTGRGSSRFKSATNRANTIRNNAAFRCNGKIYCSEMSSCTEAKFYLRNCTGTKMDGDNDGIPCEKQWCGH